MELLVAMVVLGLLSTTLLEASRLGGGAMRARSDAVDAADQLDATLQFLRRAVQAAQPIRRRVGDSRQRVVFMGAADRLRLAIPAAVATDATASAPLDWPYAASLVALDVAATDDGGARIALAPMILLDALSEPDRDHAVFAPTAPPSTSQTRRMATLQDDVVLQFSYFGLRDAQAGAPAPVGTWGATWRNQSRPPQLVRIEARRAERSPVLLYVAPRLSAPASRP